MQQFIPNELNYETFIRGCKVLNMLNSTINIIKLEMRFSTNYHRIDDNDKLTELKLDQYVI